PQDSLRSVVDSDSDDVALGIRGERLNVSAIGPQYISPRHDPDQLPVVENGVRPVPAVGEPLAGVADSGPDVENLDGCAHDAVDRSAGKGVDAIVPTDA